MAATRHGRTPCIRALPGTLERAHHEAVRGWGSSSAGYARKGPCAGGCVGPLALSDRGRQGLCHEVGLCMAWKPKPTEETTQYDLPEELRPGTERLDALLDALEGDRPREVSPSAREAIALEMMNAGVHEHRGWRFAMYLRVTIRDGCEEDAKAWLAGKPEYAQWRSTGKGKSLRRHLGQFFERTRDWPPEELFDCSPRFGVGRA